MEQEGNSLKGEVGTGGKNQEDIFRQLPQSHSTNIYRAPFMGKKLDWLLWETRRWTRWGPHSGGEDETRMKATLARGSSSHIRSSPTEHCKQDITLGRRERKLPAGGSVSELSLGAREL